jgi:hypothetical protein
MGTCTDLVSRAEFEALKQQSNSTKAELVKVSALGVTTWAATLGFKNEISSAFAQGQRNLNEIKDAKAAAATAKQVAYDANRQSLIAKGQAISAGQTAFTNQALLQNAQATADSALAAANAASAAATSLATRLAALLASAAITVASFALTQGQLRATQARIDAQESAFNAFSADYTKLINLISQNQVAIKANNAAIEANNAIVRNNQSAISAVNSLAIDAQSTNRSLVSDLNSANQRINSLMSELNAVNSKASTATSIAVATSNKLPPVPVIKDLSQVQNLSAENNRLRRQLELQQSDLNGYRVALNNFQARLPTQEDKFITRKVREQTITNASGIKDLNDQYIGIPSKIGQTVKSEFGTSIQTFKQDAQKQVSQAIANINFPEFDIKKVSKEFDAKIAKITTDFNERLRGEISAIPKIQPTEVKQIVKTEVNTQVRQLEQVNNQQATEINSKLDILNSKFPDPLTLTGIATVVGGLDILRQIKNKPIPTPTCLAPVLVPPVGAQAKLNGGAIAGLQGVTIAQNAVLQKTANVIGTTTTTTMKAVTNAKYGLEKIQGFAETAWKATHADKILNVISTMAALHNAAMLSQNVGQSLAEAANSGLSLFGVKNSQGQAVDVGQAIGSSIKAKITQIVGASGYNSLSQAWLKLNRIHQAVGATVSAIHGTKNALLEADEITGSHVAQIGNSLRDQGLVEDNSYEWMNDKPDYKENFKGVLGRLEQAEDVAQRVSAIVSSGLEIKESSTELVKNSEELQKVTDDFIDDYQAKRDTAVSGSQSPEIARLDLIKKDPED